MRLFCKAAGIKAPLSRKVSVTQRNGRSVPQRKQELKLHYAHVLGFIRVPAMGLLAQISVPKLTLFGPERALPGYPRDVVRQSILFPFTVRSVAIDPEVWMRRHVIPFHVIVTGHQAFFTEEAITTICETTINSVTEFATGQALSNEI